MRNVQYLQTDHTDMIKLEQKKKNSMKKRDYSLHSFVTSYSSPHNKGDLIYTCITVQVLIILSGHIIYKDYQHAIVMQ